MGRAFHHDYTRKCIYHITLKKHPAMPPFGALAGSPGDARIDRSPLGRIIAANIARIPALSPSLRILQYVIMPDHVHLLVYATAPLERHLGNYLGMFKVKTGQDYSSLTGVKQPVFEEDFYDCILYRQRSLDQVFNYIRDNPRRLAVRRAHPEFFRRINALKIGDKSYQAYGNYQLLDCPFKEQVVVHRADTPETCERNRQQWLYAASNGGVLVSPFISRAEKAIRAEAEAAGGRFILLTNDPIPDRYRPVGHDFDLCEAGRMLIISANFPGPLSRSSCLTLNALAERICLTEK